MVPALTLIPESHFQSRLFSQNLSGSSSKKPVLQNTAKDYILINSTNLEQREEKITTILITLKNNPSLTAKIVKSNAKDISQEYMDFLILNFYDPLQPKSCSCKSSVHIFEFIKELFLEETKYIECVNDLVDSCPLLFKMIKSLFNQVQLFDFLAIFLKKLLKRKYLKELFRQQNRSLYRSRSYKRGDTLHSRLFDGDFSELLNWKLPSSAKYFRKFDSQISRDLTKKTARRAKKRKYEDLTRHIYREQQANPKACSTASCGSSTRMAGFFSNAEQSIYEEMMLNQNSFRQKLGEIERDADTSLTRMSGHTAPGQGGPERVSMEQPSRFFEAQFLKKDIYLNVEGGKMINKSLMKDVMISLINAIRLSLPNEIKFLFHLFDLLCQKRGIQKSDVINIIFFQRFLITKCSIDNFHEVGLIPVLRRNQLERVRQRECAGGQLRGVLLPCRPGRQEAQRGDEVGGAGPDSEEPLRAWPQDATAEQHGQPGHREAAQGEEALEVDW